MAVYFLEKSPANFFSLSPLQVTHHQKVIGLSEKEKAISSLHFIHYFVMCTWISLSAILLMISFNPSASGMIKTWKERL